MSSCYLLFRQNTLKFPSPDDPLGGLLFTTKKHKNIIKFYNMIVKKFKASGNFGNAGPRRLLDFFRKIGIGKMEILKLYS